MVDNRQALDGLTPAEVRERVDRGAVNDVPEGPSRTVQEILRANIVTRFNILLSILLVVILIVAPIQDGLFGLVMVINAAIGIVQELRAKQTLDALALVSAPQARIVRSGEIRSSPTSHIVLDDVLEIVPGDQISVDGVVLAGSGLEIDEALLTGESDPVPKRPGDAVMSGSFVVAGTGRYRATKVGRDAYAVSLAEEARRFGLVRSELRSGIDWFLGLISWILIPTIALLVWSQLRLDETVWSQTELSGGVKEALRGAVAGIVAMVPQGLVLLTSMAFAIGVIRLGRRRVLVQELPAVEGLARVDVVCFDKTGTITEGRLAIRGTEALREGLDLPVVLGAIAAADPSPNATLGAIAAAFPDPGIRPTAAVPFSSARKWSAAGFSADGTWFLGAPEILAPHDGEVASRSAHYSRQGLRVLLLAESPSDLDGDALPADLRPSALVVLGDIVRSDAVDTLAYFAAQGVSAKVISGDHPQTVAAIAAQAGVPGADAVVDARDLPEDQDELAAVLEAATVFGRVTPHQKRAMVGALQSRGHVVAMTGDGVNDVLALKDADIGIAMGSGSAATRAVAQLVLLDGRFDTLPSVVGEGRRVIANIERVANLFVTKTVYALMLAFAIGLAARPFPFVPRHLTLVGSLTIGIPGFFLALSPTAPRARTGFVRRVLLFATPTGIVAAGATFAAYELSIFEGTSLTEARTMATLVLAAIGIFALAIVGRPLDAAKRLLVAGMALGTFLVLASTWLRDFYELDVPRVAVVMAAIGIVAVTGSVMYLALHTVGWLRHVPELLAEEGATTWEGIRSRIKQGYVRARDTVRRPAPGDGSPPRDDG